MSRLDPRQFLHSLFAAAVESAQPSRCVPAHLPAPPKGRTIVVGAGKAAAAMAQAVEAHYPAPVTGVVVTRYGSALPCRSIEVLEASHPIADESSVIAARAILNVVSGLGENDQVIAIISGGGSALMCLPVDGVDLALKQKLVGALMHAGAPIPILNRVRSALSQIKGGGLACAIAPARCITLIISDVVGDDPALISSGPTAPHAPCAEPLADILAGYPVEIPDAILPHLNTKAAAASPQTTSAADIRLIATPAMAIEAAVRRAKATGLNVIQLGPSIEGGPEKAAAEHLARFQNAPSGTIIISGGELTCDVRGKGKGGPNLEFCLELVLQTTAKDNLWAIACDTDGCDGNSGVAGAIVTPDSAERARSQGMSAMSSLSRSDSHGFFAAIGDVVETGATQTNVNDFRALLKI